jgi:dipeptidyl-peptidase-4
MAASTEPTETHLWHWVNGKLDRLTHAPGVYSGRAGGGTTLVSHSALGHGGARVRLERDGRTVASVASYADRPAVLPRVELHRTGARQLCTALFVPTDWEPARGPLPVLMDPYAGPHAQRVVAARNAHLSSQWLADQGFAVVVVDGRGTPGRGPAWEREVWRDLAGPVLEDQVDALHALAADRPWLDLTRVGIRGWSFGGYLAALAVLRRPDVFHAAVAGAPVTDMALYDTHYTERYLGTPQDDPEAYARCSLLADADLLSRPLMLIHGLADDNVVAAHTLRMSSALLAAGRAHTVLPLSGVTHMTPQEVVAENLMVLQVRFLKDALGVP